MQKIIAVVSGKGGVGKTFISINLAIAMHQFGEKVTIVDADVSASNMGLHLGYYTFPVKLQDVIEGDLDIKKAIYVHPSGLNLIPSAIDLNNCQCSLSKLRDALGPLEDTVIIDAPPGLSNDTLDVIAAADYIIAITNPELPSITNVLKVIKTAQDMKKTTLGVVINRMSYDNYEIKQSEIEIMTETHILATIPESKGVKKSIFLKNPVIVMDPLHPSSLAFKHLAARLMGKKYIPPKYVAVKRFLRNSGINVI